MFDGAMYLHLGDQFIVQKLDLENQALLRRGDRRRLLDRRDRQDGHQGARVDEERAAAGIAGRRIGDILVRSQATKFKKLKFHTNENVGYGDITLAADEMHTRACALVLDPAAGPGRRYEALDEVEPRRSWSGARRAAAPRSPPCSCSATRATSG